MSLGTRPAPPQGVAARLRKAAAYDGPIPTMLRAVFGFFGVSASFYALLLPVLAFQALVGWQPTHLAVWLSAAACLPVVPAVLALLVAGRSLVRHGGEARPTRLFWSTVRESATRAWWAALAGGAVVAGVGYDVSLSGMSDAALLRGAAALVVTLVLVIALAETDPTMRPLRRVVAAATNVARRPHIALAGLLLIVVAVAAATMPVIGPSLALFAPALVAAAIAICNQRPETVRAEGEE